MKATKNSDHYLDNVLAEQTDAPKVLLSVGVVQITLDLDEDLSQQYVVINTKTCVETYTGKELIKALFEAQNEANAWSSLCETAKDQALSKDTGIVLPSNDLIVPNGGI